MQDESAWLVCPKPSIRTGHNRPKTALAMLAASPVLSSLGRDQTALVTLQRIYMDPRTWTSDRIKAAGQAVTYERYKLSVQLRAGG
jgi:hypothetical protein